MKKATLIVCNCLILLGSAVVDRVSLAAEKLPSSKENKLPKEKVDKIVRLLKENAKAQYNLATLNEH
ncbi:MAG: hypothetical protein Tsb005_14070 [Gammaproteobacteria bacterium]